MSNHVKLLSIIAFAVPVITTSCSTSTNDINYLVNKNINKWNSFTDFDNKIIFNQDNSPKNVKVQQISDKEIKSTQYNNFLTSELSTIGLAKQLALPFDIFNTDDESNKELTPDYRTPWIEYKIENGVKKYQFYLKNFEKYLGYKNPYLFNYKNNFRVVDGVDLLKHNSKIDEINKRRDIVLDNISSLDINNSVHDWTQYIEGFNGFVNSDDHKSIKPNKKYLVFNTVVLRQYNWTNFVNKNTIFDWFIQVKDHKLKFNRLLFNNKLDEQSLERLFEYNKQSFYNIVRNIVVRNYIFELDELSKVLNIKPDEFKINDNIELDTKNYYKNFSGETPKNWINSKNELYWYLKLRFISSKSIEQYFEQIKLNKNKWRPYWPNNLDS